MVIQTNDDGYLVGGYSTSSWLGDKEETCYGNFDIWILKLNPDGTIAWQNTIGGSSDDKVYSIEQTNDNGYVLCGHSYSNIGVDKTENSLGLYDYWIIKLYPECSPTAETCNTLDDNCNGVVDEDVIETISISQVVQQHSAREIPFYYPQLIPAHLCNGKERSKYSRCNIFNLFRK